MVQVQLIDLSPIDAGSSFQVTLLISDLELLLVQQYRKLGKQLIFVGQFRFYEVIDLGL